MKTASLILAAGQGKRMKNPDLPKVLTPLDGKPLIHYVLDTVNKMQCERNVVVVGHQKEKLIAYLAANFPEVKTCVQSEQLGTGHAVAQAETLFADYTGDVLILAGDVPLITAETLTNFYNKHIESDSDLSVLTTTVDDATGYGRIIRDEDGKFYAIIEHKDATDEQRKIKEINSGIYLVKSRLLFLSLKYVSNANEQKEYYLTDIIGILKSNGAIVHAFDIADFDELQGVNCLEDLHRAETSLHKMRHE